MSKSPKFKVDELLARELHQLREQMIHQTCAAMQGQVYGAEKVTIPGQRKFWVHLNRVQQAAMKWLNADQLMGNNRLEHEIDQMTPVKRELFNQSFQHHERQLLQEVRTNPTGPASTFSKTLAEMHTAAQEDVDGAENKEFRVVG